MGELTATVDQLNETKKVLKERLLENNNHLGTIYSMFKAINHQHPEVVLDRAIEVLKKIWVQKRWLFILLTEIIASCA